MNKTQLRIDVDAETKQLVEAAAAEKKISVDDYLLNSVRHQLIEDGKIKPEKSDSVSNPTSRAELLQAIDTLHAEILARREGKPIDIDAIIELVRNERDAELLGLR